MELYLMKRETLETMKANLPAVYGQYYTESSNEWIKDLFGKDPFVKFKPVAEFRLADLESDLTPGEIDFNNCKIIYENLRFLSESQASDERLWAGLAHTTFYDYMRKRWGYGSGKMPKDAKTESNEIKSRFFYRNSGRSGFFRNTLAKCWWVGRSVYDSTNIFNHFEGLDMIGSNDFSTKTNELFYNFTFTSNPHILEAILEVLYRHQREGKRLKTREHIRPALSYLNAVGGTIVLDCLEKEEIVDIFSDAIESFMQGNAPSLGTDRKRLADPINIDYSSGPNDITKVVLGCKVIVQNRASEVKTYAYALKDGCLPSLVRKFTGCKVGDTVELYGAIWEIIGITF